MNNKEKLDSFLQVLDEKTKPEGGFERALFLLLSAHGETVERLMKMKQFYEFHKAFRQTDVTGIGEGKVDAAIWFLIDRSETVVEAWQDYIQRARRTNKPTKRAK